MDTKLTLSILPERFAICRLGPQERIPDWALAGNLFSVTRTPEELSIVCLEANAPPGTKCESGWRCLKVAGTLDFSQTGVLASLAAPLAEAGISIFVVSTYDTDYLMVKEENLQRAAAILSEAGHQVA
ncbi:MAG TPA: ACT domain-containing protein [Blastocatellia bacterium]|nr:ACT domain-containing protein [Blastocatellia bacterium]